MIPEKSCRCKSCVINRAWNETFPEMRMVMISVTDKAYAQGYIKYWSGRRKHYNTYWNRGEEHKGFNALCQGGGAEVVKHALINCKDLESDQMRPILTVHDSLLWEIKSELVDDAIEKISSVMRNFNFPVKMEVDAHRWGE
jgi:DNA polymerase-1